MPLTPSSRVELSASEVALLAPYQQRTPVSALARADLAQRASLRRIARPAGGGGSACVGFATACRHFRSCRRGGTTSWSISARHPAWARAKASNQPAHQQLAQMPGVSPVGLGALLLALQCRGLRRLGQVDLRADTLELLDHEPPTGRRLQRDLERLALELRQEPADRGPVPPVPLARVRAPR